MRAPANFFVFMQISTALAAEASPIVPSVQVKSAIQRSLSAIANQKCVNQMQRIFESGFLFELSFGNQATGPSLAHVGNETIGEGGSLSLQDIDDSFFLKHCVYSMQSSSVVCSLQKHIFALAPKCSAFGGNPVTLNAKVDCPGDDDVILKHIPFCVGQSCDESMIQFLNDVVNSYGDLEASSCNVVLEVSRKSANCFEGARQQFSFLVGDQERQKTCKWLQKRSLKNRERFCQNSGAREACPLTCCSCKQEEKLFFAHKLKRNETGQIEDISIKRCGWLDRKSDAVKKHYCSMKRLGFDGYEPAWKQCPSACGFCCF